LTFLSALIIQYRMKCKKDGGVKFLDWLQHKKINDEEAKQTGMLYGR
jgi:hypothetical protein